MSEHSRYIRRRRHEGPGGAVFAASVGVHTIAILLAWWTTTLGAELPRFVVYEMELVSPAAIELGDLTPPARPELVVETPPEIEPITNLDPVVVDEEDLADEEAEAEPEPDPTPPEAESADQPTSPDPDPTAEEGGEDINVRLEGVQRDYPEYYSNIIRQIDRCFRWQGSSDLRATVYFVINRDGTVSDMDVVEGSGSFSFDIDAIGAVECAGSRNRFGPLPDELTFDRLPILFKFDPARRGGGLDQAASPERV